MKMCVFSLGWNPKKMHFARHLRVEFIIYLFLHNLCVLNENLSDNILYLVSFTFKLLKQKMTAKTTSLLYFFTHKCTIYGYGWLINL